MAPGVIRGSTQVEWNGKTPQRSACAAPRPGTGQRRRSCGVL